MTALSPRPIDAVLALRAVPQLSSLPLDLLAALAREAEEFEAPVGARIRGSEEATEALLVVTRGSVRVEDSTGARIEDAGSAIGIEHLLAGERAGLTVTAEEESTVLALDGDGIRLAAEEHLAILLCLAEVMAQGVLDTPGTAARLAAGRLDTLSSRRGMNRVSRILALHRATLLPSDSMDALAELSSLAVEQEIGSGVPLAPPSRTAEGMWVVGSGSVLLTDRDQRDATDLLGPGSVVGLPEMILAHPALGLATGRTEGVALWLDREVVLDVLEDHFELAWGIVRTMAEAVLALVPE